MIALLLLACTAEPGRGFGELGSATLDANFVPGEARDLGGGAVLTNLVYTVIPTAMTLELGTVSLLELQGGGGATFDPANPPEGYGLCHGGHCHRDDGALISYADVEAELAGGDATFVAVATLPVDSTVDLLGGAHLELTPDSAILPEADISKLTLGVGTFHLEGSVEDGDGGVWPLTVELPLGGQLGAGLDLPLARDLDPVVHLSLTLEPGGTLFDDLDFAALAADSAVILDDPDTDAALTLSSAWLAVEPVPTFNREPWSE